ncbi:hypothetical protein QJS10_CPB21g00825 [Acorus calamus]|uniref:NB-ARC domain-containing protein n=1 Tax=Acorus calamus TaxID=4465 RepID=A0AAV9C3M9_ACOCL|nr:hypothetical protein QJS10_CPB21g00825 [Acorus calamus]
MESTAGSSIQLFERLEEEEKILLNLDDVWEKIDQDEVGISHGDAHPGCKIMLWEGEDYMSDYKNDFECISTLLLPDDDGMYELTCKKHTQLNKL